MHHRSKKTLNEQKAAAAAAAKAKAKKELPCLENQLRVPPTDFNGFFGFSYDETLEVQIFGLQSWTDFFATPPGRSVVRHWW